MLSFKANHSLKLIKFNSALEAHSTEMLPNCIAMVSSVIISLATNLFYALRGQWRLLLISIDSVSYAASFLV